MDCPPQPKKTPDLPQAPLHSRLMAEAVGTFALVFAGTGAVIVNDLYGGVVTHVGIAATFGLVVGAMIYAVGNISGAHFNPAVTIGFCISRGFPRREAVDYVLTQCLAALAASALLTVLFPGHAHLGATMPSGSIAQSFAMEVVLTFLLFFVILNVSTGAMEKGIMAGAAIGGTVMLAALMGGPVSGASMNPARSLGPAAVSGRMGALWLYLAAPVLGALLACPSCRWIQGRACCYVEQLQEGEDDA